MTTIYRALIVTGLAVMGSSADGQPALAIWGLAAIALGSFIRSEKWRAAYLDELGEWAGAEE